MFNGYITSKINSYLESKDLNIDDLILKEVAQRSSDAVKRQFMEIKESDAIRLSSGGQCVRKLWYRHMKVEGEPLSPRTIITFLNGDLLEVVASSLCRLAGLQMTGNQKGNEVELEGVKGHIDDLLYMPEDNKYRVVEYKSMSEFSFRRFEQEGLDDTWGYYTQASLYCEALGLDEFVLVGVCKNTGHIYDRFYKKRDDLILAAKIRWDTVKKATNAPAREYEPEAETKYKRGKKNEDGTFESLRIPTGRTVLNIVCSYCSFRNTCWPTVTQDFKGEKPIWILNEEPALTI